MKHLNLLKKVLLSLIVLSTPMMTNATTITVPATVLDVRNPTMVLESDWEDAVSYYLDNKVLVVSGYASYKSVANQTWITYSSTGSSANAWDALDPFKGSSFYTSAKYATLQAGRYTAYLITGSDEVRCYGYNNAATKYLKMDIYDLTGSSVTSIDDSETSPTYAVDMSELGKQATGVIKQALDATKTYLVVTSGTGNSNSRVFEVAFYRHPSAKISTAKYSTFVSPYATDFSTTGITVYTATAGATAVTLNEVASGKVPANTPVVLYKADADGSVIDVPVIVSADDLGSNDLKVSVGGEPTNAYVLANKTNGVGFYKWAGGSLTSGKIYLQGASSAREFLGFGDVTGIESLTLMPSRKGEGMVYDLQGRRVAQPAKGLYIVNGRKVVIK